MAKMIIVWGLWGPYHCYRLQSLRQLGRELGHEITGVSLFSGSSVNQWRMENLPEGVAHIDLGSDEARLPLRQLHRLLLVPKQFRPDVALLPSYGHWSLLLNAAVRLVGGRVVMMNETHGGTVCACGWKAALKQRIVSAFDAALVGGAPHQRYFASLGLPTDRIFTGYDAIDNEYFAGRAQECRHQGSWLRRRYDLPERYFLSLGRFVAKKNLATLIRAYQQFLCVNPTLATHLVMVGSGEEEPKLRALCQELRLALYDKTSLVARDHSPVSTPPSPGVHFYGFRQIDENPSFYALADAFFMPSLWEEWGLVVNEAMACSLPVVVSETAGCAEDLLEPAELASFSEVEIELINRFKLRDRIRRNGLVFDPGSPDELAGVMSLLASCPLLLQRMGLAGRAVVEKFSGRNFAENALRAAVTALNRPQPGIKAVFAASKP